MSLQRIIFLQQLILILQITNVLKTFLFDVIVASARNYLAKYLFLLQSMDVRLSNSTVMNAWFALIPHDADTLSLVFKEVRTRKLALHGQLFVYFPSTKESTLDSTNHEVLTARAYVLMLMLMLMSLVTAKNRA